ncbi:MAG: hypothetical protein HC836_37140 [Richelia sp. RM2_1_2]|nr:hypothetical protein [Richelia sp. RM2_1_2]
MARTEDNKKATLKNVASTLTDTPTTVSLVDGVVLNTTQNAKTAIIRGLEAGAGITLDVEDADDGRFTTTQKKIVISSTGGGSGEANTASSAGGQSLVLPKSGIDLPFKGITAGANITLTSNPTDVEVSVSGLGSAAFANTTAFATSAQGTLADSALQPGDNISELNNDAGYLSTIPAPTFRGALVGKTTFQTLAGSTNNILLTWDTEEYDTNSMHDNVTNNSRLTVPSSTTYAKVKVAIQWQSGGANLRSLRFRKNGATAFFGNIELSRVDETGSHNTSLYAETPVLAVVPGDYFEVEVDNADVGSLQVLGGNTTWFAIELVA